MRLRVTHFGRALGADAIEMLRKSLTAELGREVLFVDVAVDPGPIARELDVADTPAH